MKPMKNKKYFQLFQIFHWRFTKFGKHILKLSNEAKYDLKISDQVSCIVIGQGGQQPPRSAYFSDDMKPNPIITNMFYYLFKIY